MRKPLHATFLSMLSALLLLLAVPGLALSAQSAKQGGNSSDQTLNALFQQIAVEHATVLDLINRIEIARSNNGQNGQSGTDDPSALFDQMASAFIAHARAEEQVIYSELKGVDVDGVDVALKAAAEHHAAYVALWELAALDKSSAWWTPKLRVFKDLVAHHVQDEQTVLFKVALENFSDSQLTALLSQFQSAEQDIMSKVSSQGLKSYLLNIICQSSLESIPSSACITTAGSGQGASQGGS